MTRIVKHAWAACAALALLLSACGAPSAPTTPTMDGNAQLTAIAITVQAELTQAAELTPDPTATPEPTATLEPSSTPTEILATATLAVTAPPSNPVVPDKAEYVGQNIADNTKFAPGADFTMTWTFKNTGTSTWSTAYTARHYAGDALGAAASKVLPKEVKPGETVDVTISMKAPATAGTYQSNWVLTTAEGVNFFPFFVIVEVTGTSAATATATQAAVAATATVAPAATDTVQPLPPSETPTTP